MLRRGRITVVEIVVVLAIIGILVVLMLGVKGCRSDPVSGQRFYDLERQGMFRCVRTYTFGHDRYSFTKRVVLAPEGGGNNITMSVDDDMLAGISNSNVLYGQFEEGQWYAVTFVGFESNDCLPLVKQAVRMDAPRAEAGQLPRP